MRKLIDQFFASVKSTNFWIAIAMVATGLFANFPAIQEDLINSGMLAVGVFSALRNYFKTGFKFDPERWLKDSNTWAHIGVIVSAVAPNIPEAVFQKIPGLMDQLFSGNYQGAVLTILGIFTIIFNFGKGILKKK